VVTYSWSALRSCELPKFKNNHDILLSSPVGFYHSMGPNIIGIKYRYFYVKKLINNYDVGLKTLDGVSFLITVIG